MEGIGNDRHHLRVDVAGEYDADHADRQDDEYHLAELLVRFLIGEDYV